MTGLGLALFVVAVVAFVLLEGKRQERIYGKPSRQGLARTGLLELQRHLQPERKIEVLVEARDDAEADEAGERPKLPPARR